ncbi:MAG: hypothetical protein ACLTDR_12715 [Adlercreutzia equolifaciens]
MPEALAGCRLVGVELDGLTARIARALHPSAEIIHGGFEHADLDDESFDVAVGNVPFGSYQVDDPRHRDEGLLVHDWFFARALDLVRPGGIVAFVTSKGTLDKKNPPPAEGSPSAPSSWERSACPTRPSRRMPKSRRTWSSSRSASAPRSASPNGRTPSASRRAST